MTFADIGIGDPSRELLEMVATRAAPDETIHNEPITVTPELVVDAMLAANSAGTSFRQSMPRQARP